MYQQYLYYKAINWNVVEDELDNATWERATSLFWLDTRIPIEEDLGKWLALSDDEKDQLNRLLAVLNLLATYQSIEAGEIIRHSERSQQEIAIINNLQFTEMVNTKAYNRILRIFNDNQDVSQWFDSAESDPALQDLLQEVDAIYAGSDPLRKRFMALCLESLINSAFLAYPIHLWVDKGFKQLGETIKMVLRNESLHAIYLSHKLGLMMAQQEINQVNSFLAWAQETVVDLVNRLTTLVVTYYQVSGSVNLGIDFVRESANEILTSLNLSAQYSTRKELLAPYEHALAPLRRHDLTKYGRNMVQNDAMTDDDYDF